MIRSFLFALILLFSFNGYVFANISADDVLELNNATPGTFKVKLGTVFLEEQVNIDSNTTTGGNNASNITTLQADVILAQATADTALDRVNNVNLKFLTTDDIVITNTSDLAYVRKYTGENDEGINLAAGGTMQIITFALASEEGGDFAITPDTSSGFVQINLTATGDNATLRYIDSSIGWTLIGMGTSDTGKVIPYTAEPFK